MFGSPPKLLSRLETYASAQVVRSPQGGLSMEYTIKTPRDIRAEIESNVLRYRRINAQNFAHWLVESYRVYIQRGKCDPAVIDRPFGLTEADLPAVVHVMRQRGWLLYWRDRQMRKLYVAPASRKFRR